MTIVKGYQKKTSFETDESIFKRFGHTGLCRKMVRWRGRWIVSRIRACTCKPHQNEGKPSHEP